MSDLVHVILNPSSGSGAGRRLLPSLEAALTDRGVTYHLDQTTGPGHAAELAAAAARAGGKAVLVAGGDGTVHEVANGLLTSGSPPPLAVLPVGTGNDFHRMVGTNGTIDAALDLLSSGVPHPFDVGHARWPGGEATFVNVLGVGIDAEVLRNRDRFRRLRGLVQYGAAVLVAAVRYRPVELAVAIRGGVTISDATMLTAVSVGPSVGGGFMVSPEARPDDGLLDLLFVDALSVLQVARYLPKVLRGTHKNTPVVRMHTLEQVTLSAPDGSPFYFEMDGELVPDATVQLEIAVLPGALIVLRPGDGSHP